MFKGVPIFYELSLSEDFERRYQIRDPFEGLEELLGKTIDRVLEESHRPNYSYSKNKVMRSSRLERTNHRNSKSTARVVYVSPHELHQTGRGVTLGQYDQNSHTISIANNLDARTEAFVYYHEVAHSQGIVDERTADEYAAQRVGYHLRPGFDYEYHYGTAA